MNGLLALLRKDIVLFFSDRRAVVMSFVAPILIAGFFGYLFGDGDRKPAHVGVAVVDLDRSAVSARVLAALHADTTLDAQERSEAEALALVRSGKLPAAVTLPAGFGEQAGRAMFGGAEKPRIEIRYDPSQSMALQVVHGLLAQHVMQSVMSSAFSVNGPVFADLRERALKNDGLAPERRQELAAMFESIERVQRGGDAASAPNISASGAAAGGSFALPYTVHDEEASAKPAVHYNAFSHSVAGMGVQFVLLMGVDLGIGLLAMRRLDLWKRLRAAPLSRATLLGSRIGSTALIALIVMAVIYAISMVAFGVRIDGSVIGFVAVLIAFALLTASFGLLIAALGRTPEATRGLAILATLMLVMLGGAWVPSFIFPAWLQSISLFVPTRWAIDGLDATTWRGLPLDAALLPVGVMLAFTAVFAVLALWRFRWEE
jgi:ABC-2 type transport system permease protein